MKLAIFSRNNIHRLPDDFDFSSAATWMTPQGREIKEVVYAEIDGDIDDFFPPSRMRRFKRWCCKYKPCAPRLKK
jgi:hypothetical protein